MSCNDFQLLRPFAIVITVISTCKHSMHHIVVNIDSSVAKVNGYLFVIRISLLIFVKQQWRALEISLVCGPQMVCKTTIIYVYLIYFLTSINLCFHSL